MNYQVSFSKYEYKMEKRLVALLGSILWLFINHILFAQNNGYIEFKDSNKTRIIHFFNESVVRIIISETDIKIDDKSMLTKAKPQKVEVHYQESKNSALIISSHIFMHFNKKNGSIKFEDFKGYDSIKEDDKKMYEMIPSMDNDSTFYSIQHFFSIPKEHKIFAYDPIQLDIKVSDFANLRNKEIKSSMKNGIKSLPFLYSNKGYGILWNNTSNSIFHDGEDGTWISSDSAKYIDYFYISGPTVSHVIEKYRDLVEMETFRK